VCERVWCERVWCEGLCERVWCEECVRECGVSVQRDEEGMKV